MTLAILTILLGVIAASTLLTKPNVFRWLSLPAALVLLTLCFLRLGLYWPMFPAYLAVLTCAVALPFKPANRTAKFTAFLSLSLCLASAIFIYALPFFRLPRPTGRYSVGTRTEHYTDPATGRELVVQFWYPARPTGRRAPYMRLAETKPQFLYWHSLRTNSWQDAPAVQIGQLAQPFPLLLFGPMWGGRRTQDTFLAEELASHGYIVAAIDHPGNSARIELANGTIAKSDRAKALSNLDQTTAPAVRALWTHELALWTADNEYVLSLLTAHPPAWLAGRIDNTRIGAFGHSFGGSASMALLGQNPAQAPSVQAPQVQAPRVQAALNMDGWTFDGLARRTTEPILFLYAGPPLAAPPATNSVDDQLERQDLAAVDASLAQHGGCEAYIPNTQHADFTDQTLVSPIERLTYTGPLPGDRVRPIVRSLVLAFFDHALKQTGGDLPTYPEVQTLCKPQP